MRYLGLLKVYSEFSKKNTSKSINNTMETQEKMLTSANSNKIADI